MKLLQALHNILFRLTVSRQVIRLINTKPSCSYSKRLCINTPVYVVISLLSIAKFFNFFWCLEIKICIFRDRFF